MQKVMTHMGSGQHTHTRTHQQLVLHDIRAHVAVIVRNRMPSRSHAEGTHKAAVPHHVGGRRAAVDSLASSEAANAKSGKYAIAYSQ